MLSSQVDLIPWIETCFFPATLIPPWTDSQWRHQFLEQLERFPALLSRVGPGMFQQSGWFDRPVLASFGVPLCYTLHPNFDNFDPWSSDSRASEAANISQFANLNLEYCQVIYWNKSSAMMDPQKTFECLSSPKKTIKSGLCICLCLQWLNPIMSRSVNQPSLANRLTKKTSRWSGSEQ